MSREIFPTCGKDATANSRHGGVHAKKTCPVPAPEAREFELSCLRPQIGNLVVIASPDGNGRAECDLENAGISPETA